MPNNSYYPKIYLQAQINADISESDKLVECFENGTNGKYILDVGCGPGVTLAFLCGNNYVVGVDIIPEYCELAKKNGFMETLCIDAEKGLPFPDHSFDIIICTDLIEHVYNTEFITNEIFRVLSDEGYAILNVPNHNVLGSRLLFLLGNGIRMHKNVDDWNYFHIRFFTWKSWKRLLDKCGFVIKKFYPYPTGVPIFNFIKRVPFPKFLVNKFPNLLSRRFLVKTKKKV